MEAIMTNTQKSSASKLLLNLVQAEIIEPVSRYGKGNINSRSNLYLI